MASGFPFMECGAVMNPKQLNKNYKWHYFFNYRDRKILGIASSWINTWIAGGFYVLVALIWLIPDKRIEKNIP